MFSFLRKLLTQGAASQPNRPDSPAAPKTFKLRADQIKSLAPGHGACIATDMITVQGKRVGLMYKEEPREEADSGWCFSAGTESQEFMDDVANHAVYDINTYANSDPEIYPFLSAPVS